MCEREKGWERKREKERARGTEIKRSAGTKSYQTRTLKQHSPLISNGCDTQTAFPSPGAVQDTTQSDTTQHNDPVKTSLNKTHDHKGPADTSRWDSDCGPFEGVEGQARQDRLGLSGATQGCQCGVWAVWYVLSGPGN